METRPSAENDLENEQLSRVPVLENLPNRMNARSKTDKSNEQLNEVVLGFRNVDWREREDGSSVRIGCIGSSSLNISMKKRGSALGHFLATTHA